MKILYQVCNHNTNYPLKTSDFQKSISAKVPDKIISYVLPFKNDTYLNTYLNMNCYDEQKI